MERQHGRHGVLVTAVVPSTPAQRVGLRDQDIITHVDGQPIYDQDQFMLAIGKLPAEGTASLTVERDGRLRTIVADSLAKYYIPAGKMVTNPRPAWRACMSTT